MAQAEPPTYRLRRIPAGVSGLELTGFLCLIVPGLDVQQLHIPSFAPTPDDHTKPPSQTATLQILGPIPSSLVFDANGECMFKIPGQRHPLIFDNHFLGFTPLNIVDSGEHTFDLIALSGLASHPFGSWKKPKNRTGSTNPATFMWLRDQLPHDFPTIRVMIYGYDTKLLKSESFQTIDDLALSLIDQLKSIGKTRTYTKPLLIFAHSLGGLVVKRALCMLAASGESEAFMLGLVRLVVLFGVPSAGMRTDYLLTMVDGQPNQYLVECLSQNDPHRFLRDLNESFDGISLLRKIRLISAYETQRTPTAKEISPGVWNRVGDPVILVPKESAVQKGGDGVFPINRDHSSMVKFTIDDSAYVALKKFLRELSDTTPQSDSMGVSPARDMAPTVSIPSKPEGARVTAAQDGLKSLWFREIQHREEQIVTAHEESYKWLSHPEVGLFEWLQNPSRLYWIRGKPGSGKSTLMKHLRSTISSRTQAESSGPVLVQQPAYLWFFFHARGSLLQKSFEGLLRSILYQLGSIHPRIEQVIEEHLLARQPSIRDVWTEDELSRLFDRVKNKVNIGRQVVLFIDALDEFHGYPEMIAGFLENFNTESDDISPLDIKICFSSRPWDTFVESFDKCNGFKLQEWTGPDIAHYASTQLERMIQSESPMRRPTSSRDLKDEMVEYIQDHAEGVFLWVKMVLNDIERLPQESLDLLYEQLTNLPTELEAYYHDLIRRIPPKENDRIEAFILLELVLRDLGNESKDATPETLFLAARCAWGSTLDDCQRLWESANADMPGKEGVVVRLKDLCGGMLEVVGSEESPIIQFMHETARDFVNRPNFRQLILPRNIPDPHRFDGHVMWTKYKFTLVTKYEPESSQLLVYGLGQYACSAEQRTGKHLATFLDSVPESYFSGKNEGLFLQGVYFSRFSFAVLAGLELYVLYCASLAGEDGMSKLLKTESNLVLAHYLCVAVSERYESSVAQHALPPLNAMTKLLVEKGLVLDGRLFDCLPIQLLFWKANHKLLEVDYRVGIEEDDDFVKFLGILLKADCDLNIRVPYPKTEDRYSHLSRKKTWHRTESCRPLHLCSGRLSPTLTLIKHGADVNALDGNGHTPLDKCVETSIHRSVFWEIPQDVLQVVTVLKEAGARMSQERHDHLLSSWDQNYKNEILFARSYGRAPHSDAQLVRMHEFREHIRTAQVLPRQATRKELRALYPKFATGA